MNGVPSCPNPGCAGFISIEEGIPNAAGHDHRQLPECASCVYFSSRNCGRDTAAEIDPFDQPFI